jgi:hypothetical protein
MTIGQADRNPWRSNDPATPALDRPLPAPFGWHAEISRRWCAGRGLQSPLFAAFCAITNGDQRLEIAL